MSQVTTEMNPELKQNVYLGAKVSRLSDLTLRYGYGWYRLPLINLISEHVTLHLIYSKCIPILLYGLEACPLTKSDLSSLDFVLNRFMMKLFKTVNIAVVDCCRVNFGLKLPSVLWSKRVCEFDSKFASVDNLSLIHI